MGGGGESADYRAAPTACRPAGLSRPVRGRQEGAEALLRAGAAVNAATARGETPLRIARASAADAAAAVLLRYGARDD